MHQEFYSRSRFGDRFGILRIATQCDEYLRKLVLCFRVKHGLPQTVGAVLDPDHPPVNKRQNKTGQAAAAMSSSGGALAEDDCATSKSDNGDTVPPAMGLSPTPAPAKNHPAADSSAGCRNIPLPNTAHRSGSTAPASFKSIHNTCTDAMPAVTAKIRIISGQYVRPEDLFRAVNELGGYEAVVDNKRWQHVRSELNVGPSTSASTALRKAYEVYFPSLSGARSGTTTARKTKHKKKPKKMPKEDASHQKKKKKKRPVASSSSGGGAAGDADDDSDNTATRKRGRASSPPKFAVDDKVIMTGGL